MKTERVRFPIWFTLDEARSLLKLVRWGNVINGEADKELVKKLVNNIGYEEEKREWQDRNDLRMQSKKPSSEPTTTGESAA